MFYRIEDNFLTKGNHIDGQGYTLSINGKEEHTYPVDGWYWFDTDEQAVLNLNAKFPEASV